MTEFISQNIIWFIALAVITNLLLWSLIQGRVKGADYVGALELPRLQRDGNSVIIDVNPAKEFAKGHIPDAVNFPIDCISADNIALSALADKTAIIVCQTGTNSIKAAKKLTELGFSELHILRGGLINWCKENLPLTSNQKK